MATGTIKKAFSATETAMESLVSGITYNTNRITKMELPGVTMVHVELALAGSSNIGTGSSVGKIPSGYYPALGKTLPAVVVVENGTTYATYISINSSGSVAQSVSSTARRIYCDGWFTM